MSLRSEHCRTGIEIRKVVKELYNFRLEGYHQLFMERRLQYFSIKHGIPHPAVLRDMLINNPQVAENIRKELQINYSCLYRDPAFFRKMIQLIRKKINESGNVRIWHAGCANGTEVYSLAILLREQGLLDHCKIYATDFSTEALKAARRGVVDLQEVLCSVKPYLEAGGIHHLREYFNLSGNSAILRSELLQKIRFAKHELGHDPVFQEFDFVICRNLLIYYQEFHQKKLVDALLSSTRPMGYIGLTSCESLSGLTNRPHLHVIDGGQNIYQVRTPQ
ncbi:MAG: hypothetical protein JNL88_02135 [Bacteroidia bacterium]|nr:hypothetical protein [Bacteroidia bacterium]